MLNVSALKQSVGDCSGHCSGGGVMCYTWKPGCCCCRVSLWTWFILLRSGKDFSQVSAATGLWEAAADGEKGALGGGWCLGGSTCFPSWLWKHLTSRSVPDGLIEQRKYLQKKTRSSSAVSPSSNIWTFGFSLQFLSLRRTQKSPSWALSQF